VFGQSVTFMATMTVNAPGAGTPTGSVNFLDNGVTIGSGTLDPTGLASFTTAALGLGSHSITAAYSGDGDFNGGTSAAVSQMVNADSTSIGLMSSANPSAFGQAVTVTATVTANAPGSGTPTGSVTFEEGSSVLGTSGLDSTGVASLTISSLPVGNNAITAIYGADANFTASSSAALSQTVNQASTIIDLTPSVNPSVFGQSVTFTANVAAVAPGSGTPSGIVTFKDGSTTLGTGTLNASGVATFSTTALSVAAHSITTVYGGDGNITTSTSATLSQAVNQDSTATTLTSSANPSAFGQQVTLTATVTATAPGGGLPTGTVTFMDGSSSLAVVTLDSTRTAIISTSGLGIGAHAITVRYGGDGNFNASTSGAANQTVNQANTTTALAVSPTSTVYGQSLTLTATLSVIAPGAGTPPARSSSSMGPRCSEPPA
jgi:hypothetical protein